MKKFLIYFALVFFISNVFFTGNAYSIDGDGIPKVTLSDSKVKDGSVVKIGVEPPQFTYNSPAIYSDGSPISVAGVIWSTSPSNLTVDLDTKSTHYFISGYYPNGQASSGETVKGGLLPNKTYYIRGYAVSGTGVGYSSQVYTFKTGQPDLTVSLSNYPTETLNNGYIFPSGSVKNEGNYTAYPTMYPHGEIATGPDGTGTITDSIPAVTTIDKFLFPNFSGTFDSSYSSSNSSYWNKRDRGLLFHEPRGTIQSYRICTDMKSSTDPGEIEESNESNNCSPWANILVRRAPNVQISSNPTGGQIGLKSTLKWSVFNLRAVPGYDDAGTTCTASGDWGPETKEYSGSQIVGPLNEARVYNYTLTCTNKDGSDSDTATVTVCGVNEVWNNTTQKCETKTTPSGTLSVTPSTCEIKIGESVCPVSLTWSTKDLIAGKATAVTTNKPVNNTIISNATSSTNFSHSVSFGESKFYLYHNEIQLSPISPDEIIVNATCVAGAEWNLTTKKCEKGEEKQTTGTLTGNDCKIKEGENSCKTDLTLSILNPVVSASTNITKPINVEVASGITPLTKTGILVNYPSTTFYLNHNSETLNVNGLKINAICDDGLLWQDNKCMKSANLWLDFSVSKNVINKGESAVLTWNSNADSCTSSEFNTNNKPVGTVNVSPVITKTYYIACTRGGENITDNKTITVNGPLPPDSSLGVALVVLPKDSIKLGEEVMLEWSASMEGSFCSIPNPEIEGEYLVKDQGYSGNTGLFKPQKTNIYNVYCRNGSLEAEASVKINVDDFKPIFIER